MKKLTTLAALVMLNASLQAQGLEKDIKEYLDRNNLPKQELRVAKGNLLSSDGVVIFTESYNLNGKILQCSYLTSSQAYDVNGLLYFPIEDKPFLYVYDNEAYLDKSKDGINGNEEKYTANIPEIRQRKGDI